MDISNIVDKVSLTDILAEETETKSFSPGSQPSQSAVPIAGDFSPGPQPVNPNPVEPEEPYDAEQEAMKLVNTISSGNTLLLTPIGHWKLRRKHGGKSAITKMRTAVQKRKDQTELSDDEKKALEAFAAYKADIALLDEAIPYTEQEIKSMIQLAVPYCERTRIKINDGVSFWVSIGALQLGKFLKIVTA